MPAVLRRLSTALATALLLVGITSLPAEAAAPAIRVSDAQVLEGAGGYRYLAFTVKLVNATGRPVTVGYATADGTARVSDRDYAPARGELTFHGRKVKKTLYVAVYGDRAVEATETLKVVLRRISGRAMIKDGIGIGRIVADDPGPKQLTVALTGTGTGTVTSTPAGIDCGLDCTESYPHGTLVTLTQTAGFDGSRFVGWSGACTGAGATCVVSMTQARSVTAEFETFFNITVAKEGSGSGTVTSSPVGIDCGSTCSVDFTGGTSVTLTATATAGSVFTGWGGACAPSGTSPTCVLTNEEWIGFAVSATFQSTFDLIVTKSGAGSGAVTSNPTGINCGVDCTESYLTNTMVTLTASPDSGSVFTGWSGEGCSGTSTCVVTMNEVRSVTATFDPT